MLKYLERNEQKSVICFEMHKNRLTDYKEMHGQIGDLKVL